MSDASSTPDRPIDLLLVEDNPGDVRLVQEAFQDAHLVNTPHVVTDGAEALDFVYQRGEHESAPRPDLILLDWYLPQVSGGDVLAEPKSDSTLCQIPVIVMSGSQAQEDVIKSYSSQASAYITKPVEPDAFIETVRSLEKFWISVVRLPTTDEET